MSQLSKEKHLSKEELSDLAKGLKNLATRDSLMIEVALFTGARSQEVLNIKASDINFTHQTIYIKGVKGSDSRELPISEHLARKLKRFLEVADIDSQDRVFPLTTRRFRQIWQRYSPCGKSLHSLRHTFAIELFERRRDIRLVQFALGHRNINNTLVYSEYIYKRDELKKLLTFEYGT